MTAIRSHPIAYVWQVRGERKIDIHVGTEPWVYQIPLVVTEALAQQRVREFFPDVQFVDGTTWHDLVAARTGQDPASLRRRPLR